MKNDVIKKIILLTILVLIFTVVQLLIKNNILAVCMLGILVIVIFIYLRRSDRLTNRQRKRILEQGKKVRARILSVKNYQRSSIILSLQIEHPDKFYVTSYIITKPDAEEREKYKTDQQLNVYVNPNNQYEIFIPETKKSYQTSKARRLSWPVIIVILATAVPILLPIIIGSFDFSDRIFKDVAIISTDNDKAYIWEIRFKSPKKIFIKIYDPVSKETIKKIKDKKEEDLESYTNFFISQQNQKVYVIGTGNTPMIDVYDAATFNKISDIKDFERTDPFFDDGIASIQKRHSYNKFNRDDIIDITTNDGNKYFYDIQLDKFFDSENDVREFIEESDFTIIAKQMFAFALSTVPNSANKHKLYVIEAKNKKVLETLKGFAGSTSFDVKYFNNNKKYYYKDLNLTLLGENQYYLEAKFLYFDASLAIINHVSSVNKDAEEMISGIDKSGKTLFSFKETEYPNAGDMKENNYSPGNYQDLNVFRFNEKFVFLFGKYGALCVDSSTGQIIWKYEP